MEPFLRTTEIIGWQEASVRTKAFELARGASSDLQVALPDWDRPSLAEAER